MSAVIFSLLQYAKTLQAVGFTKEQSEVISEGVGYGLRATQDLASKNKLYELKNQLNQKIDDRFDHLSWKVECVQNCKVDTPASGGAWVRGWLGCGWFDLSGLLFGIYMLTQVCLVVMILSSAR